MTVEELYMLLGSKEAELYRCYKEIEALKNAAREMAAKLEKGGGNESMSDTR